ncbi:hypothetical protein QNN03_21825 [Streptomyces sp. GXMU-J15]|uniref:Uncharacterized protein n=1 Tax=Streptomyces fuscus TaxID=3048495 RepID=A0ABT7J426_9ACTN|nr:hypothetical protein [Streptomyces fuscus]MDL2079079.1 hypothetical protein [Streptomyces fuscus]
MESGGRITELTAAQEAMAVHEGATAYILHPEHGAMGHAPGTYLVRRQAELDDRIVLD